MNRTYAIYDMKDYEQCVRIGTIEEIANFLNYSKCSLYIYMTRKRKGKQKLLDHKYELVEIVEEEI